MGPEWFPSGTPMLEPFVRNFVDNPIVVQFVHRWVAFAVAAVVGLLAAAAWRRGAKTEAMAVVGVVLLQIVLGISTLLSGVDIHVAVAHQAVAAILLATIIWTAHRLGERKA
jgi:cytochrome c oxidase assembly protein subunit 15